MPARHLPIIAVFGSNVEWTLHAAFGIGRELARRDCVVLTGADRVTAPKTVKERTIDGVEEERQAGPHVGAWVGVARDAGSSKPNRAADGHSIVIHPGFNHKRNYLEARMCDGAIALEGGPGTRSEVAFALATGKPVVLVTDLVWPDELPRNEPASAAELKRLVEGALSHVGAGQASGNEALDALLNAADLVKAVSGGPVVYRRLSATTRPAEIVSTMLDIIGPVPPDGFTGAIPDLGWSDGTKGEFDVWLASASARISPAE